MDEKLIDNEVTNEDEESESKIMSKSSQPINSSVRTSESERRSSFDRKLIPSNTLFSFRRQQR
jgi:hypothetical protein